MIVVTGLLYKFADSQRERSHAWPRCQARPQSHPTARGAWGSHGERLLPTLDVWATSICAVSCAVASFEGRLPRLGSRVRISSPAPIFSRKMKRLGRPFGVVLAYIRLASADFLSG